MDQQKYLFALSVPCLCQRTDLHYVFAHPEWSIYASQFLILGRLMSSLIRISRPLPMEPVGGRK